MSRAAPTPGRRRKLREAFAEMHFQLRTAPHSPGRTALAVGLGTWIGCTPLYGLHLALCVGVAALCRLSPVKCYLAAHVNNPITLPFLLYGATGIGHWIFTGAWPGPLAGWSELGLAAIGRDFVVGSFVLGGLLGVVLGVVAFTVSVRSEHASFRLRLAERAARRYAETGILHWEFVRGKVLHDPLYLGLLGDGLLPARGDLLDLGCGRAIVLALLESAIEAHAAGDWPAAWPAPPRELSFVGVESRTTALVAALHVAGPRGKIVAADLASYVPPPADVVLLFDVLHYLAPREQGRLVRDAAAALRPGGRLLVREAAAAHGPRFWLTRAAERAMALMRRDFGRELHYRSAAAWAELLATHGLRVRSRPMRAGTPFANVLLEADKPADASPEPGRV